MNKIKTMNIVKIASLSLLVGVLNSAYANNDHSATSGHATNGNQSANGEQLPFKVDCKFHQSKVVGNTLKLNTSDMAKGQHLFVIENTSQSSVYLDHQKAGEAGMGAGWSSQLDSKNWSAIALNKPDFSLTCTQPQGNKKLPVSCIKQLKVCVLTNFKWEKQQDGSYWYSENKEHHALLDAVAKRLKG